MFCNFSLKFPGSGVVLDCIDSRSLHSNLLLLKHNYNVNIDFDYFCEDSQLIIVHYFLYSLLRIINSYACILLRPL